ncbi:hypothetical protein EGJ52_23730 [Pseudomonas luteola]|nr:hypothetical protein EGJ52_23730 [Pseudomonas luteola]
MRISDWRTFFFPTTFPLCKGEPSMKGTRRHLHKALLFLVAVMTLEAQDGGHCVLSRQARSAMHRAALLVHVVLLARALNQAAPSSVAR